MVVLSLFDGISGGQLALQRAGIKVDKYYASEIDKYAIQITQKNFPGTVQLGDVTKIKGTDLPKIDLCIGGSPCQGFSFAGKQLNFDDPRSKLFFEFVRLLKECKPKYFLLENVKMKKEYQDVITEHLGVEPVKINSNLLSAQNRKRLYWLGRVDKEVIFDFEVGDVSNYDKENRRIQSETQIERNTEVLGETQRRYICLQNLWENLPENREKRHNKNLFKRMFDCKQETERQEQRSRKEGRISEELLQTEQGETFAVSEECQAERYRKKENGDSRCKTSSENCKDNEKASSKTNNGNNQEINERRCPKHNENENRVCTLWTKERFVYRPYNSIIERWNEYFRESTNTLQGMQFIEERQNNGRVFRLCKYKITPVFITQPEDKGIMLKDIVHENESINTALSGNYAEWFAKNAEFQLGKKYCSLSPEKAITMTARQYASWNGNYWFEILSEYIVPFDKTLQILDKEVQRGKVGYFRKDSQANRVYYIHDKAITLTGEAGGGAAKMEQYLFGHTKENSQGNRVYTEEEKSACLNASSGGTAGVGNILFGCITPDRVEKRQNGQRFNDGKKFYTLTAQDKHGVLIEGYIRKLTPIECERLQTYPDNYTEGISRTQRYKALGNSFTVDVIAHILGGID